LKYVKNQTNEICVGVEAVKNNGPVGSIKIHKKSNTWNMYGGS